MRPKERIVFGKKNTYYTWKSRWCFLYNDWEYAKGVTLEQHVPTHFQTVGLEKMGKKEETSAKKRKVPMLVPVDDILFHKGARKHRVRPASRPKSHDEVLKIITLKKAEAEAIGCAITIIAGEER
ncbi:hypothetical protein EV1_000617 [Malus domestica]